VQDTRIPSCTQVLIVFGKEGYEKFYNTPDPD